ncbi:MAG: hypothetical protein JXB25_06630 [Deltaproteobacteria bacterium]|nr:hypothetical protein [Deltaproteobacteria bacterium]
MNTIITVLLHGGFMLSSFVFCSSLVVTLLSRYRLEKGLPANRAWLTPSWLAVLFLGFGSPFFFLGAMVWNRGETNMVLITVGVSLLLGIFLGRKVEEELRDYGKPKNAGTGKGRKKNRR